MRCAWPNFASERGFDVMELTFDNVRAFICEADVAKSTWQNRRSHMRKLHFLSATETKIELQENQRSDQIIDALIQEVIFPPALSDSWALGDPDYRKLGESTKPANLEAFSDYEEGVLTLNLAGDNWVRQGGYSDQEKDKRIGGKDVAVKDVEFPQGGCTVAVEAEANGANLVFKNESERTEAIVEKCLVMESNIVDEGQMDARATDQTSITYFVRRAMNINLPSIDDLDQAQYIADFERNRRKTPFGLEQMMTLQCNDRNFLDTESLDI